MPVPAPNLYPEFNIVRLSHIELGVTDLISSTFFYSEILGLQITHQDNNQVFLRAMEERGHHSIILKQENDPKVSMLAFISKKNFTNKRYTWNTFRVLLCNGQTSVNSSKI